MGVIILEFSESKTYQNILEAYSKELASSTKFSIYGDKARDEGYEQIGNIFDQNSHFEKEHAKMLFELTFQIPTTKTNLEEVISEEEALFHTVFEAYAETARQEGYEQIAKLFEDLAGVARNQRRVFSILLENINNNEVFCKPEPHWWRCTNCGHLFYGLCAPTICPVCAFPKGFYELYCENY